MNGENMLFQLEQVSYTYKSQNTPAFVALCELNLSIRQGEFVAITGPSGSGKSTLMHLLGLMSDPTAGQLKINGHPIKTLSANQKSAMRNSEIGFLFQQFFLLPQLTVMENILLPQEYRRDTQGIVAARTRANELLKRFGLVDQQFKRPAELSGGQKQRVALCRALMMNPKVLMCDEPTGALDTHTAQEVLKTLAELNAEGRTVIVITHDPEVAQRAARIIRIVDGRIESDLQTGLTHDNISNISSPKTSPESAVLPRKLHTEAFFAFLRYTFMPTWQALQSQRLRTALTMTGLMLGVASIFIMLTLTGRVEKIFENFFATQGSRKATVTFDGRTAEKLGTPRWRGLNVLHDLPRINEQIQNYGRLDPNIMTGGCKILSPKANYEGTLTGINSLTEMRENDLRIASGRSPLPNEFNSKVPARIALLGSDAAARLFPDEASGSATSNALIGRHITVRGCAFDGILHVIGVLRPIDSLFDSGINTSVYVPSQTLIAGGAPVYQSRLTAVPHADVSPTWFAKYIIGKLSLITAGQFPFRYFAAEQELEKFNLMMGILTGLTLVIGALCTLIGGIGVMNIMLVNVHERIQEIGIRKAVGARNNDITRQFLFESTGLCLCSGLLGLIAGTAVSTAAFTVARSFLPRNENLGYQLDTNAVLVSLIVSVSAGLIFGNWPARKAASMDIVDALKQD